MVIKINDRSQFFKIRAYKKENGYTYSLGAYPTIEIIRAMPRNVCAVYIHSSFTDKENIENICHENGIPFLYQDKVFNFISQKENCFVAGVIQKYACTLDGDSPHVVLVNPSDMGNLGTIMRTLTGLRVKNLAMISPAADVFHPKTVRAAMGAIAKLNFAYFASFEEYRKSFPGHEVYPFMLDGKALNIYNVPESRLFSLVFGNESCGLDESYAGIGASLRIEQSHEIDSLNLSIAVGIGTYLFAQKNILKQK